MSDAPLTNDTMFLTAARNAAEEVFANGLHKAMLVKASQVLALVECAEAAKALHDGCQDGTDQDDMWMALGLAIAKLEAL